MSVEAITGTSSTGALYSTTPTRTPKQTLDSSTFLSLLVTQLQNQDPSSPMDTNQMISQTTELATMEKLTSMDTTSTENFALTMRTAASNLMGNTVSWTDSAGTDHSGSVSAVSFAGSIPKLTIGANSVALDSINGITDKTTA